MHTEMLAEIQRLSSAARILEPEQAILRALCAFDEIVNANRDKDFLETIVNALLKLTNVNNGNLSLQTSIIIASRICQVLKLGIAEITPSGILETQIKAKLTPSNMVLIGQLCRNFGEEIVTTVRNVIHALRNFPEPRYYSIYAMRYAFKGASAHLTDLAVPYFKTISKLFEYLPRLSHLTTLKLVKTLVCCNPVLVPSVVDFCEGIINKTTFTQFVRKEAVKLCAVCARLSNLSSAFNILTRIRRIADDVIRLYFEKLDATVIISEQDVFFDFLRRESPMDLREIVPFLSKKTRDEYFGILLGSQRLPTVEQVSMLKMLDVDDFATASLAMVLAKSSNKVDTVFVVDFFRKLNRSTQIVFLQNTLNSLAARFDNGNYLVASVLCDTIGTDSVMDAFVQQMITKKNYSHPLLWRLVNPQLVKPEMVDAAVDTVVSVATGPLLENLLIFMKKCQVEMPQFQTVMRMVTNSLDNMNHKELIALIQLNPESDKIGPFCVQRVFACSASKKFFNERLSQPVTMIDEILWPDADDVVVSDDRQLSHFIIEKFPAIFNKATPSAKQVIMKILLENVTKESHVLLIQLRRWKQIQINPEQLFKTMTGNDFTRLQLTAELAALCEPTTEQIAEQFHRQSGSGSLLLLSACCYHMQFPTPFLLRIINHLDLLITDPSISPFVLHALSSLLYTHSSDIIVLDMGVHFLTRLLAKVNVEGALRPGMLRYVSDVLANMLPVLSSNIMEKEVFVLLRSILSAIEVTPCDLAKRIYYELSSLVMAYAPQFVQFITCKFPENVSLKTQVEAAKCISSFVKLGGTFDDMSSVHKLFVLLQNTHDPCVAECIAAIAELPVESEEIRLEYLSVVNSIFIRNTIPGYSLIDPSPLVREAALSIIPAIAETNPREAVVAVTKALEYDHSQGVFDTMASVIDILQDKHPEFLSSIKESMTSVITYACQCDLSASGRFLLKYLAIEHLNVYFEAFCEHCKQINDMYFLLVTRMCCLAADNDFHCEKFAANVASTLREIVEKAMQVTPGLPKFRSFVFDFYPELLKALVWVEHEINKEFDVLPLYAFCFVELHESTEKWRVKAAINGISAALAFYPDRVGIENTALAVQAVLGQFPDMKGLVDSEVAEFGKLVMRIDGISRDVVSSILYLSVNAGFQAETIGRLLDAYESEELNDVVVSLIDAVLGNNNIAAKEKTAILRIIIQKVPTSSQIISARAFSCNALQFDAYRICLRYGEGVCEKQIIDFALSDFANYGMILTDDAIYSSANSVLSGLMTVVFDMFANGDLSVLHLLHAFVMKYSEEAPICEALMKMLISKITKRENISECCYILRSMDRDTLKAVWKTYDNDLQTSLLEILSSK